MDYGRLCATDIRDNDFEANCSNQALRVLKYLNCLHELCAAAATADRVGEWAKSAG